MRLAAVAALALALTSAFVSARLGNQTPARSRGGALRQGADGAVGSPSDLANGSGAYRPAPAANEAAAVRPGVGFGGEPSEHAAAGARRLESHDGPQRSPRSPEATRPTASPGAAERAPAPQTPDAIRRGWPYFARLRASAEFVSTRVHGSDPAAPRVLELWRIDGLPHRIATTRSDPSGRFDFGQQLVGDRATKLQVVPAGAGGVHASEAPAASRVLLVRGEGR